ncbi:MAG: OprO/OprP family phosphate-selective porin [Nitrosomonas sp.]|nr:OprO/OprP family phosphate-selective porin [Nitrosomonas sp.]
MKKLFLVIISCLSLVFLMPVNIIHAQNQHDSDQFVSKQEHEKLKQEMEELKAQMKMLLKNQSQSPPAPVITTPTTTVSQPVASQELKSLKREVRSLQAQTDSQKPGSTGFLITGYGFAGFTDPEGSDSSFNAGFNPIFLWRLNDNLFFEGELEVELEDTSTKVALEYGQVSYLVNDYVTVGAGKFLNPSNYFMERLHPLWINKLPDKPMSMSGNNRIQASTQLGVQVRGGFPMGQTRGEYAFYASNGPDMANDGSQRFKNFTDTNNNKAVGGRVGWLPFPGFGLGYGFEVSTVNDLDGSSLDAVTHAADINYLRTSQYLLGNIDLRGQFAHREVDRSSSPLLPFNNTSSGGYAQFAYRPILSSIHIIRRFEPVFRYDWIDLQNNVAFNDRQRWTTGLNYYLADRTILKFAYRFDDTENARNSDALLFQIATGF